MNNLFTYLLELNISLVILFVAYKIFFERDKNFVIRRIYLMGVIVLPFILPLLPVGLRIPVGAIAPLTFDLQGVTVFGTGTALNSSNSLSTGKIILVIYLLILAFGLIKLLWQFAGIIRAVQQSERMEISGTTILSSSKFHASSFFRYIFIDPASIEEDSFNHILEHENIHKREWHSVDRILVELFVMINWFNPVAWMFRKSVIQNLEYLADSAMLRRGTDPMQYQLSILNQYIGSASISNQFSSQIKNRINMLNKDYKLGSTWKLALILPLVFVAFIAVSCTEKDASDLNDDASLIKSALSETQIYTDAEVMPTFQGGEPIEFRRFIAKNLVYPTEAKDNGVSGKVIIKFVIRKSGKVEIPELSELPPSLDGKEMGEVVVVAYRPTDVDALPAAEKYVELLKKEALRVVSTSPDWEPGMVDGKPVDVMFTFPINFALQ